MNTASLEDRVEKFSWYHTLELGPGVVTRGLFDHRSMTDRYLIPPDLTGMRCLDVGTMDGFWAFELERRGASEVHAVDLEDPDALDWPVSLRASTVKTMDETKGERFALAKEALGSRVQRHLRSVYDIDTDLGLFDFVFCGDLLVHLKDPATALERMRRVCSATTVICTPVKHFRFARNKPVAEFDGIDNFQWWLPNEKALERMMIAAGYSGGVEMGRSFNLPATSGGTWKGLRGVVRAHI